jgi:hypothetical protein
MPPTLPPKDIWAIYRTAVLKFPLTRGPECDMMSMSILDVSCPEPGKRIPLLMANKRRSGLWFCAAPGMDTRTALFCFVTALRTPC